MQQVDPNRAMLAHSDDLFYQTFDSMLSLKKHPRRSAFTLVELLVVIAIIGVIIGMLAPAVQAAREAARRTQCSSNMMQLALAVHQYEFASEHLPSGTINDSGPIRSEAIGQHVSWTVQLLPFIEQHNIFDKFNQSLGAYAPENLAARQQYISTFLCPSNVWKTTIQNPREAEALPICDYAGSHSSIETAINDDNNGVLYLNSSVRFDDILDGKSQTLLMGEIPYEAGLLGWASGDRSTLRNASEINRPYNITGIEADQWASDPYAVGGYGSLHPGGTHVSFVDGSVRFFSQFTDLELLRQLGDRSDGDLLVDQGVFAAP